MPHPIILKLRYHAMRESIAKNQALGMAGVVAFFLPLNFFDSIVEIISAIAFKAGRDVRLPSAVLFFFGAPFPLCFALLER